MITFKLMLSRIYPSFIIIFNKFHIINLLKVYPQHQVYLIKKKSNNKNKNRNKLTSESVYYTTLHSPTLSRILPRHTLPRHVYHTTLHYSTLSRVLPLHAPYCTQHCAHYSTTFLSTCSAVYNTQKKSTNIRARLNNS